MNAGRVEVVGEQSPAEVEGEWGSGSNGVEGRNPDLNVKGLMVCAGKGVDEGCLGGGLFVAAVETGCTCSCPLCLLRTCLMRCGRQDAKTRETLPTTKLEQPTPSLITGTVVLAGCTSVVAESKEGGWAWLEESDRVIGCRDRPVKQEENKIHNLRQGSVNLGDTTFGSRL